MFGKLRKSFIIFTLKNSNHTANYFEKKWLNSESLHPTPRHKHIKWIAILFLSLITKLHCNQFARPTYFETVKLFNIYKHFLFSQKHVYKYFESMLHLWWRRQPALNDITRTSCITNNSVAAQSVFTCIQKNVSADKINIHEPSRDTHTTNTKNLCPVSSDEQIPELC